MCATVHVGWWHSNGILNILNQEMTSSTVWFTLKNTNVAMKQYVWVYFKNLILYYILKYKSQVKRLKN